MHSPRFYSLAKPQHPINARLSTFCKMLTCISDKKLANAPSLQDLLIDFDRWMWKQGLFQSRLVAMETGTLPVQVGSHGNRDSSSPGW